MRRMLIALTAAVTLVVVAAPANAATTTIDEIEPRKVSAPIEKACPMEVVATDRMERTARSTYDDATRTLIKRVVSGNQVTLFESSLGTAISIETVGSTTLTRLADGTYRLVQRGSGYWFDDGSFSGTAELLRFTGSIRAIGVYDAGTLTFQPTTRSISGVTASICDMLVTGLKTRH